MPKKHWDQIEELIGAIRDLPIEEREALLNQRSKTDKAVVTEVRKILADLDRAGSDFLEHPIVSNDLRGISNDSVVDSLVGQSISTFKIKSRLAIGGMSSVYLTDQPVLDREVVLKVMRPGLWSAVIARRFEIESRILAHLRHPNIVQVYESGKFQLEGGGTIFYFAMEFVPEALTIVEFAEMKSLSLHQRLQLFTSLCDAISYGHRKAIIHRDIKPGNVLVDSDGNVKVIDFGIARFSDSDLAVTTLQTSPGQLLGTLAYMSPEQCVGSASGIDTRTDVYSLGMVLFELLTGRLPHNLSKMSVHTAIRVICEEAPIAPRSINQRLHRDVELIILKAISKEPSGRYGSVSEFSQDIQNYLAGEPISARPPTLWSKTTRWVARRPKTTTALLCTILIGLTLIATQISVYFLNQRPSRFEMLPNQSGVHLLALNGKTLARWESDKENHVRFVDFVTQPMALGGRRLGIICFDNGAAIREAPIYAIDVDKTLYAPSWTAGVLPAEMPPDERNRPERHDYKVRFASLVDVFPDQLNPGPELLAIFRHDYSRSALRLYSLDGRLLYQVWQDGGMNSAVWLQSPGLLVVNADDESLKEDLHTNGINNGTAHVLFALEPEYRGVYSEYVTPNADRESLRPVWYRYWHPHNEPDQPWWMEFHYEALGSRPRSRFLGIKIVVVHSDHENATFRLVIDAKGREVPESRNLADDYIFLQDELPDSSSFYLSDSPPVDPQIED